MKKWLAGVALGLGLAGVAQAAPFQAFVNGSSSACAFLGGTGTECGNEWNGTAGASHAFTSDAVVSGAYPGSRFGRATTESHTMLSMAATAGSISGSASVSANYRGPRDPDPEKLAYHAWASSVVNGQWFDTLTVDGGALGTSVLVRMTVSLQAGISGGTSDADQRAFRTASAYASLAAATERDPESPDKMFFSGTSLFASESDSADSPRTGTLEFMAEVGTPFDVWGVLGITVDTDIDWINQSASQHARVDASHTMRGYFEIVNPMAGQRLSSESGWDYGLTPTPGSTVPEPLTPGLVVMALVGLAASRRRSVRPSTTGCVPC